MNILLLFLIAQFPQPSATISHEHTFPVPIIRKGTPTEAQEALHALPVSALPILPLDFPLPWDDAWRDYSADPCTPQEHWGGDKQRHWLILPPCKDRPTDKWRYIDMNWNGKAYYK